MKAQTIQPAALAELARAGGNFSVSVRAQDSGWTVYVHDERKDYSLVDAESDRVAIFEALDDVERRLQSLGICQFQVDGRHESDSDDPSYDAWLLAQVQEALDDPSPSIPHEEAIRQIRAAIKAG